MPNLGRERLRARLERAVDAVAHVELLALVLDVDVRGAARQRGADDLFDDRHQLVAADLLLGAIAARLLVFYEHDLRPRFRRDHHRIAGAALRIRLRWRSRGDEALEVFGADRDDAEAHRRECRAHAGDRGRVLRIDHAEREVVLVHLDRHDAVLAHQLARHARPQAPIRRLVAQAQPRHLALARDLLQALGHGARDAERDRRDLFDHRVEHVAAEPVHGRDLERHAGRVAHHRGDQRHLAEAVWGRQLIHQAHDAELGIAHERADQSGLDQEQRIRRIALAHDLGVGPTSWRVRRAPSCSRYCCGNPANIGVCARSSWDAIKVQ